MGLLARPQGMLNSPHNVKGKRAFVFHSYYVGKSCPSHQGSHNHILKPATRPWPTEKLDGPAERITTAGWRSSGPHLPSSSPAMWSATSLITSFGLSSSSLKQSFQMANAIADSCFTPPKHKGIFNQVH